MLWFCERMNWGGCFSFSFQARVGSGNGLGVIHPLWGLNMVPVCLCWVAFWSQWKTCEIECLLALGIPESCSPRTVLCRVGGSAFLCLRQSGGHRLLWRLVCLSVSGLGGGRVKLDSLCLSACLFVGPLSSCQPSQWDNCPLYSNLPTFRVAAFTVPILLRNPITTGFWMQSFMISGYKQCAAQQRHLLYFLIFL